MHIKMRFDAHHAKFSCNSFYAGMCPLLGNDDGDAFACAGRKKGTCRDNTKRVLFRCETKETGHKRSKEIERKKQIKKRRGERERATDLKLKAIQSKWSLKFCSFFFVLLHFCRNSEARSLRISFTFCLGTKMQSYGWRIIREMTKSQKRETTLTHTEHREM